MVVFGILLIIFGGLATFLCGITWFCMHIVTTNNENWEKFWKDFDTLEKNPHNVPEDVTFNLCLKVKNKASFICIVSLILALAGVGLLFIK